MHRKKISLVLLLMLALPVIAEAQMESEQVAVQPLWASAWSYATNIAAGDSVTFRFDPAIELAHMYTDMRCSVYVWNSDTEHPAPRNALVWAKNGVYFDIAVPDIDSIRVINYGASVMTFCNVIGDRR